MYSTLQLATRYFKYFFTASNGKGHGIHSPFVFEFVTKILNDNKEYPEYASIELARQAVLQDERLIDVTDYGAGSSVIHTNKRVVKDIAASSLKPKKYAQLLFRMVRFYHPKMILELGTSLGITSAYLAKGNPAAKFYTMEGAEQIASIARKQLDSLQLTQTEIILGNFDQQLPELLQRIPELDFIFIDGNHQEIPTLDYFSQLLPKSTPNTVFIFDDIHWSQGMEAAWEKIKAHPSVTLTIDLFYIGIVKIDPAFKEPVNLSIRY